MLTAVRYTAPGNACENRIARPEDTLKAADCAHAAPSTRSRDEREIPANRPESRLSVLGTVGVVPQPALQHCSRGATSRNQVRQAAVGGGPTNDF